MSLPPGLDFCSIPAQMPPEGQMPDYDDWSSLPLVIIVVCAVMMSSAVFLTAGRIYANMRQLAWSDCKSVPGVPFLVEVRAPS